MNKMMEYLSLLPKGMKNPEKVLEGIWNNIKMANGNMPEDEVEEIMRRRLICAGCEFMSKNAIAMGLIKSKRTEDFCSLCQCPILGKTASLSSNCGIVFYNEGHPDTQLVPKWTAYKKEETDENI